MKRALSLLAALALALGCSSEPAATDAGADVPIDVGSDISIDAPIDVPIDTTPDVAPDAAAPGDTPDAGPTLATIEALVLRPHCAIPSCHASAEPTGRMRLDEDFARTSLRGVAAMGVSCRDQGLVRVVPGDPAASLLYRKISEDAPPCGSRMPQAADPLPPALIALVREWIAAGAP